MTPDLKRRLDEAAEAGGRSQSQEAEVRLEKSFERESLLPEVLSLAYGPQLAGILMLLGAGMEDVGQGYVDTRAPWPRRDSRRPWDVHWTDVPVAFEFALLAAERLLRALRPRGDAMNYVEQYKSDKPLHGLPELIRTVRHGSKHRCPTPKRDLSVIRSLLGPLAHALTEAKLAKSISSDKSALRQKITEASDALVDLINSSPRSPSRQQLAELLQKHLLSEDKQVSQGGGGHG